MASCSVSLMVTDMERRLLTVCDSWPTPHPTTKQSHVKFTRDFVDSCHPLCLVPPTPTPRFKRERVGVFFWSSVPPSVLC